MALWCGIFSILFVIAFGYPAKDLDDFPMENPDLFEGDILGYEEDDDRNAVVAKHRVWPNGTIPYDIDPALDFLKNRIEAVMADYSRLTDGCIQFKPREEGQYAYVRIFRGRGCYSHVGKTLSDQPLSLGPGCSAFGTISHELGHAIGFYHEHSRSDRDDHITIYWDNIQKGMEDQFKKLTPKENKLFDEFDYDSIMLYGEYIFSIDHDNLKTMVAKKEGVRLADVKDKAGPSDSDIYRIKKLYNCEN